MVTRGPWTQHVIKRCSFFRGDSTLVTTGDGDCWTCFRTVPFYRGGCGFTEDFESDILCTSVCFIVSRYKILQEPCWRQYCIHLSDSFKSCIFSARVVQSVTVGPRYGTGFFLKSSVSDWLQFVCVRLNTTVLRLFFLQQETIEVESENVFKLAAFALQVRKSLSQAFLTEIYSPQMGMKRHTTFENGCLCGGGVSVTFIFLVLVRAIVKQIEPFILLLPSKKKS